MKKEIIIKICTTGSFSVGKTSLIRRYAQNTFSSNYLPTLGMDVTVKRLTVDDQQVRLLLVDTAGQEQFGKMRKIYYEGSSCCIAVYDITRPDTLETLPDFIKDYKEVAGDQARIVILGNKIDLEELRKIPTKEGKKIANQLNYPFYECSAKDGGDVIPAIYENLAHQFLKSLV
ncbi:MAG: Rab family GTPase [Candidatus Heimdallarchaeota archaeon]